MYIILALPDCSIRVFQSLAGAGETLLTFKDQCKLYAYHFLVVIRTCLYNISFQPY